MEGENLKNVF